MKRTQLFSIAALAIVASLLLAACGGSQSADAQKGAAQAREPIAEGLTVISYDKWEKGKKGGRFVVGQLGQGPKTFNPALAEETSSTDITERLGAPLVQRNQFTLQWEAAYADSYKVAEDEKSVSVKLRKGQKWSDGTPVTSKDWVDAVNLIYYNEGVQTSTRDSLMVDDKKTVWTAIDDLNFTVTAESVYAGLVGLLNFSPLPMHIMGPIMADKGAEGINTLWGVDADVTKIPSTGAWVIKEHVPGQRTVFAPNPNYYEKDAAGVRLPYLDELVYLYTPDQDTLLQRFLSGEVDYLAVRGVDYKPLLEKKDAAGFTIYEVGPSTATNFVAFNQNPIEGGEDLGIAEPVLTWLSKKEFRTAIAHLIDRETLINNVEFGFGYPQYSFVPRFSPYYWDGVDEAAIKFDPTAAAALLDQIGYKDTNGDGIREDDKGNKIELSMETNAGNRAREAIGNALAQEAKNIGIQINFRPVDFNVLVGKLTGTYDWNMIIIGLTGDVDPVSGANVYPSSGNLHMVEPNQTTARRDWEKAVDLAWKEANNTTKEDQRKSGYEKLQKIWAEELPWSYTYNVLIMEAYKSNIGNIRSQPTENYDWEGLLPRLYIKPAKK